VSERATLDTAILLVGMAAGVFAGFAPSWFTVASPFFHEQSARAGNIKRIRWAEVAGTTITVAMGWALSHEDKSTKPLIASVLISMVFVGGYEYMIRHPATDDETSAP
jgi:hypothetical protein